MLTCYDVSAIMGAINLVQIHMVLMKSPLNYPEIILTYGHDQRVLWPHDATLPLLVTASVQYLMTRIYILFTSVMTHLISWLIVNSRGIRESLYKFGGVIYSTNHQLCIYS